jgi:hypothetical protein
MHSATLDAIEVALFGDNWRRSRDELVERAEALRKIEEAATQAVNTSLPDSRLLKALNYE